MAVSTTQSNLPVSFTIQNPYGTNYCDYWGIIGDAIQRPIVCQKSTLIRSAEHSE